MKKINPLICLALLILVFLLHQKAWGMESKTAQKDDALNGIQHCPIVNTIERDPDQPLELKITQETNDNIPIQKKCSVQYCKNLVTGNYKKLITGIIILGGIIIVPQWPLFPFSIPQHEPM